MTAATTKLLRHMPKIHKLQETWKRRLSLEDFLRLAEDLESAMPNDSSSVKAKLRDGSEITADSVEDLRSDLASEADVDVIDIDVLVGEQSTLQLWLERDRSPLGLLQHGDGLVVLRAAGSDESSVHGAFGPFKRRVEARFAAIDRGETQPVTSAPGSVTIGSITAGNVAVSSGGQAAVSSGQLDQLRDPWWRETWITLGAPLFVAVLGGILLALLLGH
jgi:hypothetical protein